MSTLKDQKTTSKKWVYLYRYQITDISFEIAKSEFPHNEVLEGFVKPSVPLPGFVIAALINKIKEEPDANPKPEKNNTLPLICKALSEKQKSFIAADQGFLYQYLLMKGQAVTKDYFADICNELGVKIADENFLYTEYLYKKNDLINKNCKITPKGLNYFVLDSPDYIQTIEVDSTYRSYKTEDCSLIDEIFVNINDAQKCRQALTDLAANFTSAPYDVIEPGNLPVIRLGCGSVLIKATTNIENPNLATNLAETICKGIDKIVVSKDLKNLWIQWGYFISKLFVDFGESSEIVRNISKEILKQNGMNDILSFLLKFFDSVFNVNFAFAGVKFSGTENKLEEGKWIPGPKTTDTQIYKYKVIKDKGIECYLELVRMCKIVDGIVIEESSLSVTMKNINETLTLPVKINISYNTEQENHFEKLTIELINLLKQNLLKVPKTSNLNVSVDDGKGHCHLTYDDVTNIFRYPLDIKFIYE